MKTKLTCKQGNLILTNPGRWSFAAGLERTTAGYSKGRAVMDRQSQHLPEADNSAAASSSGILIEPLNLEQGRRVGCGPVEAVPVEVPPVILPMTRREAVLLLYLMDLTTDVELVQSGTGSTASYPWWHSPRHRIPTSTNPPTHKEFSNGTS